MFMYGYVPLCTVRGDTQPRFLVTYYFTLPLCNVAVAFVARYTYILGTNFVFYQ
jgi:hypothetical protein